ncbi:hypothetical protein DRQ26_05350, partial [bacterium]
MKCLEEPYFYLCVFFVFFLSALSFSADIPRVINYQGKLFESGGPVSGTKNIGYRLYDAASGGTLRWEQSAHSVTITDGLFSDTLGLRIDTTLVKYSSLWLAVVVEGTELARERLWASPWALTVADGAISTDKLADGTASGQILQYDGSSWQLVDGSSLSNVQDGSSANQTLRWDGSQWVSSDALLNDDTDVETSGDLTVGGNDIYGNNTGSPALYLHSNGNIRMDIDDNNDGSSTFGVRNGGNSVVFEVTEAGNVSADGNGTFDGNLTLTGASRTFSFSGGSGDITSTTGIDVIIDSDNDNTSTQFTVQKNTGTTLFSLWENASPMIYPYGTSSGNTGGIRFRELSGSNYTGFRAPDVLGSDYMYTLPTTDGSSGQVLSTDGSGALSWIDVDNSTNNELITSFTWTDSRDSLQITEAGV